MTIYGKSRIEFSLIPEGLRMKKYRHIIQAALIVTFLLLYSSNTTQASEPNWPQFRGPGGLGIAPDNQAYPAELDPSKNLLWKTEVPEGHSSPCIWADRVFITASSDKNLETICIDRRNGAIKWRKTVEPEKMEGITSTNSHASPTPACDGKRVYVYFGSFGLLAYDFDGQELWRKILPLPQIWHGSAASPIVADNKVIINCDSQKDPYLLAVEASTGETIWKRERPIPKMPLGWSTPVLWRHAGEKELVVLGSQELISYKLEDGQERWRIENMPTETAATPVYTDETLYVTATALSHGDPVNPPEIPTFKELLEDYDVNGDERLIRTEIPDDLAVLARIGSLRDLNTKTGGVKIGFERFDTDRDGAISEAEWETNRAAIQEKFSHPGKTDMCLAISSGGSGDITKTHVQWKTREQIDQVTSPLYYRGRIYLVKYGGIISCFDAKNGDKKFSEKLGIRGYYYASPVAANGKIYVCPNRGMVIVVQAADEFKILAQSNIGERIYATPALVDGNVYLRTDKHIYAFGE